MHIHPKHTHCTSLRDRADVLFFINLSITNHLRNTHSSQAVMQPSQVRLRTTEKTSFSYVQTSLNKIFKQPENSKKGGQQASKMVLEQIFFMQFFHYESIILNS